MKNIYETEQTQKYKWSTQKKILETSVAMRY